MIPYLSFLLLICVTSLISNSTYDVADRKPVCSLTTGGFDICTSRRRAGELKKDTPNSHGRLEFTGKLPGGGAGALHLCWKGMTEKKTKKKNSACMQ